MKIRHYALIILLIGISIAILSIVSPIAYFNNYALSNPSTGIIGGADAPTYTYILTTLFKGLLPALILLGIGLVISSSFCLIFANTVKKCCSIKTSAISIFLSAVGASGLGCALVWLSIVSFGQMSKHPIEYPVSIILGIVCLLAFIALIALYLKCRKANWSIKGIVIDVLTSVIYLPAFFFAFAFLYNALA